ncbi:colicin release lysis protein, partial [Escherichia coli]
GTIAPSSSSKLAGIAVQ